MIRNITWAVQAVAKCRKVAYNSKSQWAKDYWNKVADDIEENYCQYMLADGPL